MHTIWKKVVLESYPKVDVSPEREIAGMGAILDRRTELTKEVYRAARQKRAPQRFPHTKK